MSHRRLPAPVTALVTALVTVLVTALALVLGPGSAAHADPAGRGAAYEIPTVGSCHTYSFRAAERRSESSTPVACTDPHVARTIAVTRVRSLTSDRAVSRGTVACDRAVRRAVGSVLPRTAYTTRFFVPSRAQARKGARWVRCDLVLAAGRAFAPLPTPLVADPAADPLDDTVGLCAQTVRKVTLRAACAGRHDYRYTAHYRAGGATYPGQAKLLRSVILRCARKVSTPKKFWAFYPDASDWQAGRRDVSCLSRTSH